MTLLEYMIGEFNYNEPIEINSIRYYNYSRSWLFKELRSLIEKGEIKRFASGTYYIPKKMFFGDSYLDPRKVVERRFITNGIDIYGYISGVSLLNQVGLSTQVPNMTELVTNRETTRVRDLSVGNQRVRARRARTTITTDNVKALQLLDLVAVLNPDVLGETERFMLSRYIKSSGVTRTAVAQNLRYFPARTAMNLMECEVAYELA